MTNRKFTGTGVAVITPFNKEKNVDFPALGQLIDHLIINGADYLVALGTTAETVTLSGQEKSRIISLFKERISNRVPLVVGIGGNDTKQVTETIRSTDLSGVAAILSVTPYYNKPGQRGLYAHFRSIAEQSPVDIILYNVPGRTSVNMSAETTLSLASDFSNIIAVKEASGNFDQIMKICRDRRPDFAVISGDDAYILPQIAAGMDGVISVAANAFTAPFTSLVKLAIKGLFDEARQIHFDLLDLYYLLFAEGNPAGVKAALHLLGMIENELRLPLVPVSDGNYEAMKLQINQLKRSYNL
jgi:4-hydroxy-tetrahydrodipicolinate synthase